MVLTVGRGAKLLAAYMLDGLIGDPQGYPHPVRVMGRYIDIVEGEIDGLNAGHKARLYAGCGLTGLLTCGTYLWAHLVLLLPGKTVMETLLLYAAIARKDLEKSSLKVAEALEEGDMEGARLCIRALVGRDPEKLDEHALARAAVESVAENLVDGVLAPLLWAALGGAPAALAFKAVSTLDSMIGHRDQNHLYLGRCAAKMDDLACYLTARMSIPLISVASFLCGYNGRSALKMGLRDRLRHQSPNSAHAEAAFAGALGLKLGGSSEYAGRLRCLPEIGEGTRRAGPEHIRSAARLLNVTSLIGLALAVVLTVKVRR